jgi:NAD(P)-dependent dehydrogenase (short-subunit alcohol dehydrogenase family)
MTSRDETSRAAPVAFVVGAGPLADELGALLAQRGLTVRGAPDLSGPEPLEEVAAGVTDGGRPVLAVYCGPPMFSERLCAAQRDAAERALSDALIDAYRFLRVAASIFDNGEGPADDRTEEQAIVIVASSIGLEGQPGSVASSMLSAALLGAPLAVARELAPLRVRAFGVAQGLTRGETVPFEEEGGVADVLLLSELALPWSITSARDLAQQIVALVFATKVSGCVVRMDGGLRWPDR